MIKKFGVQLFTVRDYMKDPKSFDETCKKLKKLGYDEAQTAGIPFDIKEFAKIANDNGIEIIGTHADIYKMFDNPEEAMEEHKILGTVNAGTGGMPGGFRDSAQAVKYFCKVANEFGKAVHPHGFRFTYHNHSFEFKKFANGQRMIDILFENLDPVTTSFCMDTYWVQHGGGDVRAWMEKFAGRLDILHLKDMEMGNDGQQHITSIGNGNLEWKEIVKTAEKIGVKHYIVEQDNNWVDDDPFKALENSANYIKANLM